MRNLLFILLTALIINGCKNELEINAPWVETPVVYGFLDAHSDTQYIRVQKTYQNSIDQTTREAAQIADSLYFGADFEVKVISNLNEIKTFERITLPKTSGVFENETHYIYRFIFNPGVSTKTYKLSLHNPKNGNSYNSGMISLMDSARFDMSYCSVNVMRPDPTTGKMGNLQYRAYSSPSSRIGDFFIRLYYSETYVGGVTTVKYVDYFVEKNLSLNGTETRINKPVDGNVYIDYLKNYFNTQVGINNNVVSRAYTGVEYFASLGDADLAFVTDLSKPSTSIVPKNTQYTNIPGALGIFSAISIHHIIPRTNISTNRLDSIVTANIQPN